MWTRRERARKRARTEQFTMKAVLMPCEVGLKSERDLLTAWYLAGVTSFMLPVVMLTVRHVNALHQYKKS